MKNPLPKETARHPFEARLLGAWPDERLATILTKRVERMLQYFPAELQMDMAHTVMLAEQGILTSLEASSILRVLAEIEARGVDKLRIDRTKSTLFWHIEAALIEALGAHVGGKMHTGRSHNDILPTLSRLTARDRLIEVIGRLLTFRHSLLTLARQHVGTVMPGYTALQHGQPWTFGHYLSGWDYAFSRDFSRLKAAYGRTNLSPLGASALAGSSWPLDRGRTASLLGFDGVLVNSRDAGFGNKDYVAEILAAIGILMTNLSILSSDLYLWSTYEFGMVELADGFCGTSSIMPQKKNPWAVDWVRGAAGNAVGYLASCLGALKGSSSTDASMQDYPEVPLPSACTDAADYLNLISGVLDTLEVKKTRMLERARSNWTTASNLADAIVRSAGVSYRSAHGIVGKLVRESVDRGLLPRDVTGQLVDQAAVEVVGAPIGLSDDQVQEALDPTSFVESRVTQGSVKPEEVSRMLDQGLEQLRRDKRWLERAKGKLVKASQTLRTEVERYVNASKVDPEFHG